MPEASAAQFAVVGLANAGNAILFCETLPDALPARRVWLATGLSVQRADGEYDVMRGKETQVCGLLPA